MSQAAKTAMRYRVRFTLRAGKYIGGIDVAITHETGGFHAIESAVDAAYHLLPWHMVYTETETSTVTEWDDGERMAYVDLIDGDGNSRVFEDTELRCMEWLKELIACAELLPC